MNATFGLLLDAATIFVFTAWLLSLAAAVAPLPAAPAARSREALRLVLLPSVGGTLVLLAAFWPSMQTWLNGSLDHCGVGAIHPHLCWIHAAAGTPAWHDAIVGVVAAALVAALVWRLGTWALAARRLHALEKTSDRPRSEVLAAALRAAGTTFPGPIWVIPTDAPWCFVVGVRRPTLVVTSGIVDALSEESLAVVAAHEAAHVRRSDPAIRLLVTLATVVHAPGCGRRAARRWAAAAELACDDAAATLVGSRVAVAETLVHFQRLVNGAVAKSLSPRTAISFGGDARFDARVRAVLDPAAADFASFRVWPWVALAALAWQADQVHTLLETLLGALHG